MTIYGPDEANREAGLRLDQPDSATALLDSGTHAIVPHNCLNSEQYRASQMPFFHHNEGSEDHKFDPLSQKDFYSLFAFFDDIDEAGLYSFFTQATPTPKLKLTDSTLQKQIDHLTQELQKKYQSLNQLKKEVREKIYLSLSSDTPLSPNYGLNHDTIRGEIAHYSFDNRLDNGRFQRR